MACFDVYANPGEQARTTPYLLEVQRNLLDSRMVVSLRSLAHFPRVKLSTRLTPVLRIKGKDYLLETPKMGAVPQRILKTAVASLAHEHAQITGALDFRLQGY